MRKNPWAYAINYDKEIAEDEKQIAWFSSPFAVAIAERIEALIVTYPDCSYIPVADLLVMHPELLPLSGLTVDDARALLVYSEEEKAPFGEEQRGDYARGAKVALMPAPDGYSKWLDFRTFREAGKAGRVESLKRAKASLSRHKRNKAKYA